MLAVVAASALAASLATTARAESGSKVGITFLPDDDQNQSIVLTFDRSLLATPAGLAGLHREIAQAARHVCRAYFQWNQVAEERDCRDQARADAEKSLGVILAARERATQVASAP